MGGALLDNVEHDQFTSFVGVDLNGPSFVLADQLQRRATSQHRV